MWAPAGLRMCAHTHTSKLVQTTTAGIQGTAPASKGGAPPRFRLLGCCCDAATFAAWKYHFRAMPLILRHVLKQTGTSNRAHALVNNSQAHKKEHEHATRNNLPRQNGTGGCNEGGRSRATRRCLYARVFDDSLVTCRRSRAHLLCPCGERQRYLLGARRKVRSEVPA